MKLLIEIDMDNDEFQHACEFDCGLKFSARAVRSALERVSIQLNDIGFHSNGYTTVRDTNGNTVGKMELSESLCGERNPDAKHFMCSRPHGHTGEHIKFNANGQVISEWRSTNGK